MKTLDEAWSWYEKTRRLVRLIRRLAERYWENLPLDMMEKDNLFKDLEDEKVAGDANDVLEEFDDVAVFVMFSVFEKIVRDQVIREVEDDAAQIQHPALKKAVATARENLKEASFYIHVLDLYKNIDHDIVEQVNQVRHYRNWVAHGRRPDRKPNNVTPRVAFDR